MPPFSECYQLEKVRLETVNLLEEKGCPFPRQCLYVSLSCSAFFPLSFFSLPILSGAFQMNSLFWPRICPYECFMFDEKDPAYCWAFAMVDIKEFLLLDNVLCGRSFWAVDNIEGHPCAFLEGFETL